MIKKKIVSLICVACLMPISLFACGKSESENEEKIELLEPVGVAESFAYVEKRDLYASKSYTGKVVPDITEVRFTTYQTFEKYGKLPGDDVKKGDVIIFASTEGTDKKIDDLKEKIANNEIAYLENSSDYSKDLSKLKSDEKYYEKICNNFKEMNAEEQAAYNNYASEYAKYSFNLANTVARREHLEETIKEETELYELDADYNNKLLKRLEKSKSEALAKTTVNGTVVSVLFLDEESKVQKNQTVAAVGDFNSLQIATESISKSDIKRAADVYAVINGKRYEVEYIERAKNSEAIGEASFSGFSILGETSEVLPGDYAVITVVSDKREDVLCVPSEAIVKDSEGAGVYVYRDGETVYTPVKTGIKNGYYTEILSGLNEGDRISSEFTIKNYKNTAVLEKGTVSAEFEEAGYIFYSINQWIKNPVEYGTTYVDEVLVSRYENVEKGQTIAKIHVKANDIEISRQERNLLRAYEDLKKLQDENDSEGKNDRLIKKKTEAIADLEKLINDMKNDSKMVSIKAPFSGIITSVNEFEEGDILLSDGKVAMIAAEDDCFIVVEDDKGQLTAGNEALVEYKDADSQEKVAKGTVVTVSQTVLPDSLKGDYALIRVSPEDLADMSQTNRGYDGWWMRSRFNVKVTLRKMENVVLVPKKAVVVSEGLTYVVVPREDGTKTYKSFISGGSDNTNYWVIDGLTEGMTICLD